MNDVLKYKITEILSRAINALSIISLIGTLVSLICFIWLDNYLFYLKLTATLYVLFIVCKLKICNIL